MILTEADAKQRWCPFARVLVEIREGVNPKPDSKLIDAPASFNRKPRMVSDDAQASPLGACCIASACMAWRELHPKESREDHSGANVFMAKRAVDTHRAIRREGGPGCTGHLILDAVGFCGLAGKP